MGWLGPSALAAGALGTNLYFALLIFGIGLMSATAPVIAEELGRRRHSVREVRRTVRQGFWAAVTVAIPIWTVGWNGEAILLATGQEPVLAKVAAEYIRALQWSLLPFLLYLVLRSFLSALERPGWALVIGLMALPVNVGAAYCLMFGKLGLPNLGLVGCGLRHRYFQHVHVRRVGVRHRPRPATASIPHLWTLLAGGLAALPGSLAHRIADWHDDGVRSDDLNAAALLMGRLGTSELAAHAIALQIASVSFMVPFGLGQAATVRVGRAFGAQDHGGVTRAGWTAFVLGVGFMACTAVLMLTVPHVLISAFLDMGDPKNLPVVGYATSFLMLAAFFQIADGAQAVGSGMLRGLQDTRVPMIYAAIGYWGIGLPLGIWLAFGIGMRGIGIWIGLATGLGIVAALMLWRWLRRDRLGLVELPPQELAPA